MELTEIGRVDRELDSTAGRMGRPQGECFILMEGTFTEGLYRLREWRRIHVLFASSSPAGYRHPWERDGGACGGVSPCPGMAVVDLLGVDGNRLKVRGLDAAHGSPVYDLRPVVQDREPAPAEGERETAPDRNPRQDIMEAVRRDDRIRCLRKTAEIHGHFCPGSALGVMASLCGLSRLGLESFASDGLENLMAVVETNACFADGVQAVSGCTLGNNALVYRDLGRHAVTFAVRGRETGVRVRVRPDFRSRIQEAVPEFYSLMEKVIMRREGTAAEASAFREAGRKAGFALLKLPFEALLIARTVRPDLPSYAPIAANATCPVCGEWIMATKVVEDGKDSGLCLMCAGRPYRQVEGAGIVERGGEEG